MKWKAATALALIVSFSVSASLGQDDPFLKQVEAHMRRIANSEEGLADPGERARLQKAMSAGGDWDSALIRLVDPSKYDQQVMGPAISVLQFRGSFGQPEVQAAVITYFKARVKADRAHNRSDPLFNPAVRISGLASSLSKSGGPDLLLAVLDYAGSADEQADPLLDVYALNAIADALLEKGDSRHLEGMRKLLAITKDAAVKEKLERTIAEAETTQPKTSPKPSIPQAVTPSTPLPTATPSPATPSAKVVESPAPVVEQRAPVWPWLVGIVALVVIVAVVWKRRA